MNEIINNIEENVPEVLENVSIEAIEGSGMNVGKILLGTGLAATAIAVAVGVGKLIWDKCHKNAETDLVEEEPEESEDTMFEEE